MDETPSAEGGWTVGIVADTVTGDVVLRMTEEQAISLRDSLMWLMDDGETP